MTPEDHDRMVEAAGGRCEICGKKTKRLHVDHCHKTNEVRGLLCMKCNGAIGALGDTAEGILKAYDYLRLPFRYTKRESSRSEALPRDDRKQRASKNGRDASPSVSSGRKRRGQGIHGRKVQQSTVRPNAKRSCGERDNPRKKSGNKS